MKKYKGVFFYEKDDNLLESCSRITNTSYIDDQIVSPKTSYIYDRRELVNSIRMFNGLSKFVVL